MKKIIAVFVFCLIASSANAWWQSRGSNYNKSVASSGGYVGPGNLATFGAWWGLRAYSAATIGNNVVKLRRSSDNTTQDFVSLADGSLDVASIATFKGADNLFVDTLYDQTANGFNLVQHLLGFLKNDSFYLLRIS